MERRVSKGTLVRAAKDDVPRIFGYAAVFNQEYVLWNSGNYRVVELIKPGAFTRALKEKQDVRCLFNHDPSNLLGRTRAGTLTLKQDPDQGLYFNCELPDTATGRDVRAMCKRGDISGCSFAFTATKDTVTEQKANGKIIRTRAIEDVDLFDVGPVTYPAYDGTSVNARNARSLEMRSALFPTGPIPGTVLRLIPELDARAYEEMRLRHAGFL